MNVVQSLSVEQKQALSRKQIQSLELLAMGTAELNTFLEKEYMENPLLEYCGQGCVSSVSEHRHEWWEIPAPSYSCIEEYVKSQLNYKSYTNREWRVIDFFVKSLDDSGYCCVSSDDAEKILGEDKSLVWNCLYDLKHLEPAGIFSNSLKECLLRQAEVKGILDDTLREMICCHLEELSDRKIGSIARHMEISLEKTKKYIALIFQLRPRPLTGFGMEKTEFAVPDVILKKTAEVWKIYLNDDWADKYVLSDYYIKMYRETQDEMLKKYFKSKLARYRMIMEGIHQRKKTIISVVNEIVKVQQGFFEGRSDLKPLSMEDVANCLNVNVSTVSRAVREKFIQYPYGTVAIKNFFSIGAGRIGQCTKITSECIKNMLKELVESEDKEKPYSDQRLVDLLKERNINISRRAITKYRKQIGVRSSSQRKMLS